MVHSMVNSSDADAAQRQVDHLFSILQQLLHDTMQWLATRNHQQCKQEDVLRIWMGNGKDNRILRQVYGPMANGKNRNDLTPERLRSLLDAIQQPVTEGVDPSQYAKRNPAIEIKIDDVTLFRQERDGVVTINQIQQQIQNVPVQSQLAQAQKRTPKAKQPLPTSDQIQQLAQVARHLMNPMGEPDAVVLNKARFGDFTLEYDSDNDALTISRKQQVILRDRAGQVENLGVTAADWEVFRSLMNRIAQATTQPIDQNHQQQKSDSLQNRAINGVAQVADRQIARLPNQSLQHFLQRVVQGTATWLNQALYDLQLRTMAHTALRAFHRGYERTAENTYQIGDFTVSQQPENRFTISDRTGKLMQFQNSPSEVKVEGLSSRITHTIVRQATTQFTSLMPEGQHETDYAFRVLAAEQTVRDFLIYMKTSVWDYEQGKFRLEMIDNQILITSKQDGRGQVHGPAKVMQKNHREKLVAQPTRLTWKDLDHLDSVRERLRLQIEADQAQQPKLQPVSTPPRDKVRQVSQRPRWQRRKVELE
ncbi:MAG: hypothetical protein MUC48_20845 [Leptolyngbya sp. Prado105]|jgi:hypothetical protein|nr:hypothetical protein [Leptolyngbya sp. Prado105]